jgi:ABC-type transport system substrate-binding protein
MWGHQASAVTLMAWVDSVNDPAVHNARILQTGSTWSQYSDSKLDALLNRIDSEMDMEKRRALIVEQQHYMRETFPVAYLEQIGIITGVSSKLAWWRPMPNDAHRFYRLNTD